MADLLLELFSEEIPARMQEKAALDLVRELGFSLAKAEFKLNAPVKTFVTPRRLTIIIEDVPVAQPDVTTELKGPRTSAPAAALDGFLKKNNLTKNDLIERDGIYCATVHQKGKPTADVLKSIIEGILQNFPWPKSMRWGAGDVAWVRPLHSILCIFDGKVVPVEFGGVKAGNVTYGHRFLNPEKITITNSADYEAALEKAHVVADRDKRKAEILKQAEKAAAAKGLTIKKDDGLLDEVTGLVEWPVVLIGAIDAKFMDLPPEVLSTVMKKHQKYFALHPAGHEVSAQDLVRSCADASASHRIAANFLITANMETKDSGKAVIAGNERVLRARFSDARFFWDQDCKKPLAEWANGLKDVTFHAKLGTVADKVERIKTLALQLTQYIKADTTFVERAAALCKADLTTGMVGEFAELQGIMGRYYALQQGEDTFVADAIRDHYKPQGPADSVPHTPVSIVVALADKLDTLIGLFMAGEKPTGSKDPFALRRAALGVIRIILDNNLRFSLGDFISSSSSTYDEIRASKLKAIDPVSRLRTDENDLLSFFIDRLKVQLKDSGIRHDVINAVVADGDDDLVRIVARAKVIQEFIGTDDGKNLLAGYKRAANILAIEEKKDKTGYVASGLQSSVLKETEEKELAALLAKQSSHIDNLREAEQYAQAMTLLAGLRAGVDRFFDKIMVNCDDKELRINRLRLLASIRDSMDSVARFSAVEG